MEEFDKSISFDGRDIRLKIGLLAPQAGGSVLIQSGETAVLVTATTAKAREGVDFLPLTVDYEERLYAAGRIPGGFLRREGRPPEKAILTGRLIDRPLRPLFPSWLRDDIQVVATTLSMDEEVPPDVLAVTGASVAVMLAGIPFQGPMAAVRVGLLGDEFIINPTYKEIHNGELDLVVAGSPEGVVMIEAGANQLPERDIIEAIDFGYEAVRDLISAQRELIDQLGIPLVTREAPAVNETVQNFLKEQAKEEIKQILCQFTLSKTERDEKLAAIENRLKETITALPDEDTLKAPTLEEPKLIGNLFKDLTKKLMRAQIIEDGVRVDGRQLDEVRPISCRVGVLPRRVHGSGLFNRGLTQVLSIATLGTPGDAQDLGDDLHPEDEKRYLHHYNFPPFSVGETRPMRSPGRREIGHGALAERAIVPVLPPQEEFPYVLRVVSEVLSSNGSTSMGSVCGSTLALMDAGVPLKKPVSGAAMGLIKEGEEVRILTDIQGIEDFLGDMDFKVAGTDSGITALQMDMKIPGLSMEVVAKAIEQALPARKHILEKMLATLEKPRTELSPHAPRLLTIKIDPDLIGLVIGPGGKTVKGITEQTGTKIDIDDDGTVTISSTDGEQAEKAKRLIYNMTRKLNEGEVYLGRVTRIIQIGAFVEVLPGKEGMIHISQLAEGRVGKVEDEVAVGDEVLVKVREIDSKGRLNLTRLGIHPDEAAAARKAATVV
ncbi:MAG: polyribonucleotide nucleotidyltransferase [Microcystis aeruginosa Ma_QC_Ch_20071001_S25]|jgi:polyribonucleotide nucleotidyltransferase|uniref:Polyribonucleotide nucleotidyltransferase n=1 Tax=Microcystis aeruginosa Ma_QC_Ch_20071001_S25D TaxID=2486250 RepID=A0A552FI02_MICAE|nr:MULTISPECIES: polyribonucleotide nucleotidyltransferase [unclassified Microcystis]MCA2762698.1 polyribonucleotide nucleotidyltransferase [Microcystis sp. M151S2]TRU46348.1 MAG: polyribonucleotide nucleotidyltransferase [Microcystis aeruginosa Ma_QC_Ch_20071001_S25D]TRU53587.1 MAG: polyribonucleotide nucleotidyltransferase [Microcystis aeruginosa Ma_QC_Ch_20071001_S25]TRU64888.1 MAG: polyribonucleotide nucleotidyltransferase [Microcystis aeruginosa Ma_QC_Ch_20071001_M135]MCA2642774.1 polyrib